MFHHRSHVKLYENLAAKPLKVSCETERKLSENIERFRVNEVSGQIFQLVETKHQFPLGESIDVLRDNDTKNLLSHKQVNMPRRK